MIITLGRDKGAGIVTITVITTIQCDKCFERFEPINHYDSTSELMEDLQNEGWVFDPYGGDYCPTCAKKVRDE